MLTQRGFWTTIALATIATSFVGYQLVKVVDRMPQWVKPAAKVNAPKNNQPSAGATNEPAITAPADISPKLVSREVGIYLKTALASLRTQPREFENARIHLANAERAGGKTPFDRLKINEVGTYLYALDKNYEKALQYLEATLNEAELKALLSSEQLENAYRYAMLFAQGIKNYPKSAYYAGILLAYRPAD